MNMPCFVLILVGLALAATCFAAEEGVIANGGFEELNEDGTPADWALHGDKRHEFCTEAARTGNLGMRIVATDEQQFIRQQGRTLAHRSYVISGWFKATGFKFGDVKQPHARLYIHVLYEDRPYSDASQIYRDLPEGTYDWRRFAVRVLPNTMWPVKEFWVTVSTQFAEGEIHCDDIAIGPAPSSGGTSALDWANGANPRFITDLSLCEPADSLADRRLKGKWKVLDYEMGDLKGNMLSANFESEAPEVSLPLNATGWHAVYLGLAEGKARVRLTADPAFVGRVRTHGRVDEVFFKAADLTGERLHFAQASTGTPVECNIMYVKLVPLTNEEVERILSDRADLAKRSLCTTIDGFSYLYGKGSTTEQDLLEEIEEYRNSDFGTLYLQMSGADFVNYASDIGVHLGARDGELIPVFPRSGDRVYAESLQQRARDGVNATEVHIRGAHDLGMKVFVSTRPAAWVHEPPMEEYFVSPFYTAHPEWRCVDRDSTPVARMSFAVPEVRRYIIEILREAVRFGADGACVLYNRGVPLVLWEEPFCRLFREKFDAEAREVPENDPRISQLRVEILTTFMTEIRAMLDEEQAARGNDQRLEIAAMVLADEADNLKYGIDVRGWVDKGLLDDVGPYLGAGGGAAKDYDLAFFAEACGEKGIPWRPTIIAWRAPTMDDMMDLVLRYYDGGATGVTFWDGNSLTTRADKWSVVSRMGHVDELREQAEMGAPTTATMRPHRIGEFIVDSRYSVNWGF